MKFTAVSFLTWIQNILPEYFRYHKSFSIFGKKRIILQNKLHNLKITLIIRYLQVPCQPYSYLKNTEKKTMMCLDWSKQAIKCKHRILGSLIASHLTYTDVVTNQVEHKLWLTTSQNDSTRNVCDYDIPQIKVNS